MRPQPESTNTEVLAGLIERVTYHNSENGFCTDAGQGSGDTGRRAHRQQCVRALRQLSRCGNRCCASPQENVRPSEHTRFISWRRQHDAQRGRVRASGFHLSQRRTPPRGGGVLISDGQGSGALGAVLEFSRVASRRGSTVLAR
jgi:hypothetical protein